MQFRMGWMIDSLALLGALGESGATSDDGGGEDV